MLHNCGEGVNVVVLSVLTGKKLSRLGELWNETWDDRQSLGVNGRSFRGIRFGGYGIGGSGTVQVGRLATS